MNLTDSEQDDLFHEFYEALGAKNIAMVVNPSKSAQFRMWRLLFDDAYNQVNGEKPNEQLAGLSHCGILAKMFIWGREPYLVNSANKDNP